LNVFEVQSGFEVVERQTSNDSLPLAAFASLRETIRDLAAALLRWALPR
jgi:hypothetical protein